MFSSLDKTEFLKKKTFHTIYFFFSQLHWKIFPSALFFSLPLTKRYQMLNNHSLGYISHRSIHQTMQKIRVQIFSIPIGIYVKYLHIREKSYYDLFFLFTDHISFQFVKQKIYINFSLFIKLFFGWFVWHWTQLFMVQTNINISWSKEYFHSTLHNRLGVKLVFWWMETLKVVSLLLCTAPFL